MTKFFHARTPTRATLGIFSTQKGAIINPKTPQKKFLTSRPSCFIISPMVKIIFKHWKTGKHIQEIGTIEHDRPDSDRLVLRRAGDGKLVDIIKETIVIKEIVI